MNNDSYLEPPYDPRDPFFEKVIDLVPDTDLSPSDYEANEQWFIDLIDKLYDLCPRANPYIVSLFVKECWSWKRIHEEENEYDVDWDYPEFSENY